MSYMYGMCIYVYMYLLGYRGMYRVWGLRFQVKKSRFGVQG